MGFEEWTQIRAKCDGVGCYARPGTTEHHHAPWFSSAAHALSAALRSGWGQIETATGSKLLCRVCTAKHDLSALDAALDKPDPVQATVLAGVNAELAKGTKP